MHYSNAHMDRFHKVFFFNKRFGSTIKEQISVQWLLQTVQNPCGLSRLYSLWLFVLYSTYDVCYVSCVLPLKLPFVDFCCFFSNFCISLDTEVVISFFLKWKVPWTSVDTNAVKRMQTTWQNRRDKKCLLWQGNFLKYFFCHFISSK